MCKLTSCVVGNTIFYRKKPIQPFEIIDTSHQMFVKSRFPHTRTYEFSGPHHGNFKYGCSWKAFNFSLKTQNIDLVCSDYFIGISDFFELFLSIFIYSNVTRKQIRKNIFLISKLKSKIKTRYLEGCFYTIYSIVCVFSNFSIIFAKYYLYFIWWSGYICEIDLIRTQPKIANF